MQRICLKSLAPITAETIRELHTTTCEELANHVVAKLGHHAVNGSDPVSGHAVIRRRVYDVINVLTAAGIAAKDGKWLTWLGVVEGATEPVVVDEAQLLDTRQRQLEEKMAQLLLYKMLLQRNWGVERPPRAVSLPTIVVGMPDAEGTTITQPLDGSELHITPGKLVFMGSLDLLTNMGLSKEKGTEIAHMCSPELIPIAEKIVADRCRG
jgi:hypothetical protein